MAQVAILAVGAVMQMNKGAQERKLLYQQAESLRDAGNRKMAATTAEVSEGKRQKEHMYSRALAVAAASGGGVDDAGMVALMGDLNAEGEYRVLSRLYTGTSEAEGLRYQSEQAMRDGDAALNAGYVNAATTVMSAYGSGMFGGSKAPTAGGSNSKLAVRSQMGGMEIPGYELGAISA